MSIIVITINIRVMHVINDFSELAITVVHFRASTCI